MTPAEMRAEDYLAHKMVAEDMGMQDFMGCTLGELVEIQRRAEELTGFRHKPGLIEYMVSNAGRVVLLMILVQSASRWSV